MKVEIWSDVVCPWCYIGKRRFEAALARFAASRRGEVEWRSFELDPGAASSPAAEAPDASGYARRLAGKYGTTEAEAEQMLASMTGAAALEGLDFRFDRAVPANTFDAHQLVHLAAQHGRQDEMKERLLRAYFTEGAAVGDREVLVRLATEVGLDAEEVRTALSSQRFAPAVRDEQAEATRARRPRRALLRRRPQVRRVRGPARGPAPRGAGPRVERGTSPHGGRVRRRCRGVRPRRLRHLSSPSGLRLPGARGLAGRLVSRARAAAPRSRGQGPGAGAAPLRVVGSDTCPASWTRAVAMSAAQASISGHTR